MALAGLNKLSFLESLTVDPEVMRTKAAVVSQKISSMQQAFEELEQTVNRTDHYWVGEAANAHRELYQEKKEDIHLIFSRLSEDVSDLYEMANIYSQAESQAEVKAADLPSDVIF